MNLRPGFGLLLIASALAAWSAPSDQDLLARYKRADDLGRLIAGKTANVTLRPIWLGDAHLLYRSEKIGGTWQNVVVELKSGRKAPAFDHKKAAENLAKAAGAKADPDRLSLDQAWAESWSKGINFYFNGEWRRLDPTTNEVTLGASPGGGQTPGNGQPQSPDGRKRARVTEGVVEATVEGLMKWVPISPLKTFERVRWSPDSRFLAAFSIIPGDRKPVYRLQSSLPGATRAKLLTTIYDQPGDKMDTAEIYIFDLKDWKGDGEPPVRKVQAPPFFCTQYPYHSVPSTEWWKGGSKLLIDNPVRGYQSYEVWEADPLTGEARIAIKEESKTFVDLGRITLHPLTKQNAFIWRSESSGWGHLYRVNGDTGERTPITSGDWVVRSVERVDEERGTIDFTANGREPGDPYHLYSYRVRMDGSNLTLLTPGRGTHETAWSPDRRFFVDTYSSMDKAPIHELRRADGSLVTLLERADVSGLAEQKIKPLMPFTAKGRDGKTDIWGGIAFPTDFDPAKKYPVIENIYAGPHDSHVPKKYFPLTWMHRLAELGFIVVQVDGMGTNNRGKAFHDVAWKNLADAGFPDRIAWMKAAAAKFPAMDLSRVGVYGTSAGGQNAAGALLFHPDFYKVGVASCGCHDNRMDKQWWNEQWMGYPVGPHYEASSNITHAAKLKGRLLLMVGEIDSNVPPESTYKLVDALIKAKREFEFVLLPGLDHTGGGDFGERKRRDFFVKWLLGKEPPAWNEAG